MTTDEIIAPGAGALRRHFLVVRSWLECFPLSVLQPTQALGAVEGHETGLREALLKLDAVARHRSSP